VHTHATHRIDKSSEKSLQTVFPSCLDAILEHLCLLLEGRTSLRVLSRYSQLPSTIQSSISPPSSRPAWTSIARSSHRTADMVTMHSVGRVPANQDKHMRPPHGSQSLVGLTGRSLPFRRTPLPVSTRLHCVWHPLYHLSSPLATMDAMGRTDVLGPPSAELNGLGASGFPPSSPTIALSCGGATAIFSRHPFQELTYLDHTLA